MSAEKLQVVNELHRPTRKNFRRRHVIVKGLDELFEADLVDMKAYSRENKSYKYILTVIDVLSKYAWAEPVMTKSGKNVTQAFAKILQQSRVPKLLHTDEGLEFFNKDFGQLLKKYKIKLYNTFSVMKASVVERFNRTLKEKMWKRFSFRGNYKWLDILPELVTEYNNSIHRNIGMRPNAVGKIEAR